MSQIVRSNTNQPTTAVNRLYRCWTYFVLATLLITSPQTLGSSDLPAYSPESSGRYSELMGHIGYLLNPDSKRVEDPETGEVTWVKPEPSDQAKEAARKGNLQLARGYELSGLYAIASSFYKEAGEIEKANEVLKKEPYKVAEATFKKLQDKIKATQTANNQADYKKHLGELAQKYASLGYLQEAIWTYRELGQTQKANSLETELLREMQTAELSNVLTFPGRTGAEKVQVGTGTPLQFAIMKSSFNDETFYEELAYQLDRLLDLNVVPVTVTRTEKYYSEQFKEEWDRFSSVQYFVRDANPEHSDKEDRDLSPGWGDYTEKRKKLWLLDFLLNNVDRRGVNWHERYNGHEVAIDNEASFKNNPFGYTVDFREDLLPDEKMIEKLLRISPESFSFASNDLSEEIQDLLKRRGQIIESWMSQNPEHPICKLILKALKQD